eukprot:765588-Hanusia_phi.AAC.1
MDSSSDSSSDDGSPVLKGHNLLLVSEYMLQFRVPLKPVNNNNQSKRQEQSQETTLWDMWSVDRFN